MNASSSTEGIRLLLGGQAFFPALIRAIDTAAESVQLETYIFDMYGIGSDVAEALMRAARRGAVVQVMADGIGSDALSPEWAQKMAQAGVQWCVYSPVGAGLHGLGLLMPDRWRRLHRKLCVVDQQIAFCGGINILDDFYDPNHGALEAPRFDFAIEATGPLAAQIHEAVSLLWWRVQAGYSARKRHLGAAWDKFKAAGYGGRSPTGFLSTTTGVQAMLVLRDNLTNRSSIEKAYLKAIGHARDEILIANAYFMPGRKLRRALTSAAQRGVKVTLLLHGTYEHFMQYHAARPVYDTLLKAGIDIHEYKASFLHAKVAVVDGHWATVGSSNLDPLSLLLAREANVMVEDVAFAGELRGHLCAAIARHGSRIDPATYRQRPFGQRLLGHLAYALMRIGIWIAGKRY